MKGKIIIIALLAAMLLSGCRVESVHTSADVTTATTAESTTAAKGTAEASTTAEKTTAAATTSTEEISESSTTVSELTDTPTLPPASEAVEEETEEVTEEEEIEEVEEEDIIEDEPEAPSSEGKAMGCTYDGEEFEIDPDYAYFIVNKEYFLPDDYSIETDTVQGDYVMEKTAAYFCREMIAAAKEDGIDLKIISAYRTVKYQKRLFERNVESRMESGMTYEEAYADVSVNIAPPGGSEHNAGLAVDIVTKRDWDTYTGFEDTEEFAWLMENAPDYGFILRYLKGKEPITGYIYEPWHFRYVGIEYARQLQESGLCMEEFFELNGLEPQGLLIQ